MDVQPISEISSIAHVTNAPAAGPSPQSAGFADVLVGFLQEANNDQLQADQSVLDLANGKTDDLQSVVIATAQADLSFRLFLEMRNKLTESYQELSRMQF